MNGFRVALAIYKGSEDSPLGQVPVEVDWTPAVESARLDALRQGAGELDEIWGKPLIAPIWHSVSGEPHLEGFRVTLARNGSKEASSDYSTQYFRASARQASARLIESGKLESGEAIRFLPLAFPYEEQRVNGLPFTAEEMPPSIELEEAELADVARDATVMGTLQEGDLPVFVPRRVLDESSEMARQAFPRETGGILIGHLCRDRRASEVFVRVTAQIHAKNAVADSVKLTFTPEAWTDVRAALELRRGKEMMLGWWHSHPVREWCKACDEESQKRCAMAADFFSAHDRELHRTVFPRAYSIGLVANDVVVGDVTFSLHGWRKGQIEARGFHVREKE